jgi:hypothetical protein
MVGDYISTSWLGNRAFGAFAVGQAPSNGKAFDEGIFVRTGGLNRTGGFTNSSRSDRVVVGNSFALHANRREAIQRRR